MAQYKTGSVSISHNSATVIGLDNTNWVTAGIQAGWIFKLRGDPVIYWIDSVDDEDQITLQQNYINKNGVNVRRKEYMIIQDYTTNFEWPKIKNKDWDWPDILTYLMHQIDKDFYERRSSLAAEGISYTSFGTSGGSFAPTGTIHTVSGGTYYQPHSTIKAVKGKVYYDNYYNTLVFYDGSVASATSLSGSTVWYPQWRSVDNT